MNSVAAATSSILAESLVGRLCKVTKRDFDWCFTFGKGLELTASVPWRIVTPDGIALAATDDGQQFGLPQPVNGEAKANDLLAERRVAGVRADELTGDLSIDLGDGFRLDLFNASLGYEGWEASLARGHAQPITIIAMGRGGFTTFFR
jgi:hypothetical protein